MNKIVSASIALGTTLMLTAAPALAQEDGYQLSLAEALSMALENNLDLVSAKKDPMISEQEVETKGAGFDFVMTSNPIHREEKQEISNAFSFDESKFDQADVAFSKNLMFGADFSLDLSLQRSEASGPLVLTPSSYGADLGFNLNVPLLGPRGATAAGRLATTSDLVLAQTNLEISKETLRAEAHRVLEETENAYWNVLANQEALRIARLALKRARDLLELNRKKVEVGTLAPIEITQAEAGVASQEEGVIVAETELFNSEDELRRLLAVPAHDMMWAQSIIPTNRPDFEPRAVVLDEALDEAMANRPELINAKKTLHNDELREKVARKRTRPGLNLNAGITPSGNNFETIFDDMGEPIGQETTGVIDEAIKEIPDFDNYNWSVELNFRYPIGNRDAKASYSVASLNRAKSEIALGNQEQSIRVDVRRSVRAVESGIKRINAAQENVRLQTEKLDAEQKKFENGMSTSFEVLTFQNDLADAELALIRAALDYTKALTALERSKGTLLQARGLSLD